MANDNKNTLSRKIDEFHKFKPIQDNEFRDIINVIFPALSLKDTRKKIQLYSDGGADPNPGKGGYGIILSFNGKKKELSQGYKLTTNNRMELLGIITGLNQIKESAIVEIYTDSKYVINGIEKGWAKKWKANNWYRTSNEKAINSDLWNKLLDAIIRHETMFYWVKGHNGHLENERCDELATLALNSRNLIEDKGYIPNDNTPVIINPTIKTAYSQNNIKMTHEGQPCRKCETPVEKKIPKRKKLKPHQSYYYEYYLNCPNCRCIYHLEEAKRYVKD